MHCSVKWSHSMKIAILGTRGIPNQYGGFEEFAEKVSLSGCVRVMKFLCIVKEMKQVRMSWRTVFAGCL